MKVVYCILIILKPSINYAAAQGDELWINLIEVSTQSVLCPYESMVMSCQHSSTYNQPDWRVTNHSVELFRSLNFKSGHLANHRIINDTKDEEVLMIDSLLPQFDQLEYSCLYDLYNGPLVSNSLKVDIQDVPEVTGLKVESVSGEAIQLSWQQTDPCGQTTSFVISTIDTNKRKTSSSMAIASSRQSQKFSTQISVSPLLIYTVSVTAVASDGRKSATQTAEYRGRTTLTSTKSFTQSTTICGVEPHTCALYAITAVLLLVAAILGAVLIAYTVKTVRCSRTEGIHSESAV